MRHVVFWLYTNVSEVRVAYIFRAEVNSYNMLYLVPCCKVVCTINETCDCVCFRKRRRTQCGSCAGCVCSRYSSSVGQVNDWTLRLADRRGNGLVGIGNSTLIIPLCAPVPSRHYILITACFQSETESLTSRTDTRVDSPGRGNSGWEADATICKHERPCQILHHLGYHNEIQIILVSQKIVPFLFWVVRCLIASLISSFVMLDSSLNSHAVFLHCLCEIMFTL